MLKISASPLLLLLFGLAGCSEPSTSKLQSLRVSNDMVISRLTADQETTFVAARPELQGDCVSHIEQVTCFSQSEDPGFDADCSFKAVKPELFQNLSKVIAELPPLHQKVFCHLDRLQIQPGLSTIGYASQIVNEKHEPIGTMIGFREDALKGQNLKADLESWKEQLNFGFSDPKDPSYKISDQGPKVEQPIPQAEQAFVLYVLTHEISHLVDFMNNANKQSWTESSDQLIWTAQPDSFSMLSWPPVLTYDKDMQKNPPEWVAASPWLSQLCYYGCNQVIAPVHMLDVYQALQASSFFTAYSANSPYEDFAEASSAFLLKPLGFAYRVVGPQQITFFDLEVSWKGKQLEAKRKWLLDFYNRSDLQYKY